MNRLRQELRQWWDWVCRIVLIRQIHKTIDETPPPPKSVGKEKTVKRAKPKADEYVGRFFTRHTLSDLLEDLDSAFKSAVIPFDEGSWIQKDMAIGLKKLGAHVPAGFYKKSDSQSIRLECLKKMPEMMSLSFARARDYDNQSTKYPDYVFAFKQKRPYQIHSNLKGVSYYVGGAFGMGNHERDKNQRRKLWWFGYFAVVDPTTGAIEICDELRVNKYHVGKKRQTFTRQEWTHQSYFEMPEKHETWRLREEKDAAGRSLFAMLYHTWSERSEAWSVAVTKRGDRVTFGVPSEPGATAAFFADRDKTVKTANGSTKKIIHIAREHNRLTASGKMTRVKTHIRGLDRFDWKGYSVVVRSPEFHGLMLTQPEMKESDAPLEPGDIAASRAGKLFADMEDAGLYTGGARRVIDKLH